MEDKRKNGPFDEFMDFEDTIPEEELSFEEDFTNNTDDMFLSEEGLVNDDIEDSIINELYESNNDVYPLLEEDDDFGFDEDYEEFNDDDYDLVEEDYEEYETDQASDNLNDISDWIGDINPNFDPYDYNSPYCNNCGSCAYAIYRRLEGDTSICATAENIPYNSEMEALTGMEQVPMSPYEIEARLLEQGSGAHAIIGVDRAEGPGHWFNAANINGKVYAIDGQTGEIRDWPPDYGNVVNWEMSVKRGV